MQTSKGKKATLLSTQGAPTIKQNIVTIFGSKQFEVLAEFVQATPTLEAFHVDKICNALGFYDHL